jgi:hypothetical protein
MASGADGDYGREIDGVTSAWWRARRNRNPAYLRERPHCHYWRWAASLKRSLGIDGDKCDRCGARMKLRALVIAAANIARLLRHFGEPVDPPVLAPARGPPFRNLPTRTRQFAA